jgi:hypothetical protein
LYFMVHLHDHPHGYYGARTLIPRLDRLRNMTDEDLKAVGVLHNSNHPAQCR